MIRKIYNHLLKNNFNGFFEKAFQEINPGKILEYNWHTEYIAKHLEEVTKGNIKRLIINLPPRYLKSQLVTVAWPAWILANDPTKRIICTSYSQKLSDKHSLDSKKLIECDWFKQIFPRTKISKEQNQKFKFMTTSRGFRFATSVDGTITGEGGDVLIVDDPHNPRQALSALNRTKVINWFEHTLLSRLDDKKNGAIIIVMQRLHDEDLSGHLLSKNKSAWVHLNLPAIAQSEQQLQIGSFNYLRKINEPLHKEREDLETLMRLQNDMGIYNFASQYLQAPMKSLDSIIKREWISFYKELPDKFNYIVQSWDTAIKTHAHNDYSVLTSWGVYDNKYYLLDLVKVKLEFYELVELIKQEYGKHTPVHVLIEDKASGQSIIQELNRTTHMPIIPIKVSKEKLYRLIETSQSFVNKTILFPEKSHFIADLIHELLNFPNAQHDDQVDSLTQAINYLNNLKAHNPQVRKIG
ncbi:phage terminase large subunit [Rickettsiales endosymbiont of Stachyamoeba lipophora]|uniref:phage terminase large subunit n=1 Tax=Rickettsiales endosymbiont of Stachyamoeba lipophora TaxID=2486578 RepID=UPI0013DDDD29|nr:phage terminase large subunit [Rickettsiales endosymbiont of Stachyamoeba lipophora]